jgi:trimeric autotransporter adhesin
MNTRNFGIATIAGSPYDPSGDNGPAALAGINLGAVAFRAGVLYLTDGTRIRKISPDGTITTVVGLLDPVIHQPIAGFSGDGGPALGAQIRNALSLAFDSAGNLYIADAGNSCIRKVTARVVAGVAQPFDGTETITTVAGIGTQPGNSADPRPATSAKINFPRGLAIDEATGTLYFADQNNNNIRKVDPAGIMTTIGGTGLPGFNGDNIPAIDAEFRLPTGVAVDPATLDVYVADVLNSRVRKISASTGLVTTFAGTGQSSSLGNLNEGGSAIAANVHPVKVLLAGGILYVVDSGVGMIRTINIATGIITTLAGSGLSVYTGVFPPVGDGGPALAGLLGSGTGGTQDAALDDAGNVFIADASSRRVRFVANASTAATVFGKTVAAGDIGTVAGPQGVTTFNGDGGPAISARLFPGGGIAFDPGGSLYFSDSGNNIVRRIEPPLTDPTRTIVTIAGNRTGGFAHVPGPATAAEIQPGGLAFNAGNLFLTNNGVRILEVSGSLITLVANAAGVSAPMPGPATTAQFGASNIAFDVSGNLYVGDTLNNRIWKIDTGENVSVIAGGGMTIVDGITVLSAVATSAMLFGPGSIAFDPDGNLYTVDGNKNRILKISAAAPGQPFDGTETITIFAGTGQAGFQGDGGPATAALFNGPGGLVFDPAGNLYFTDSVNFRVREIDTNGIINTIAGNGVASFAGDGGPATSAEIRGGPLAFDSFGNLFMVDSVNNVIRVLDDLAPTVTFGIPVPPPNSHGWNNGSVIVPFDASDTGAGVGSTSPISPLVLADEGDKVSRVVTASDRVGNTARFTSPVVRIDREAPVITGMPEPGHILRPADGRLRHVATVTAADAFSGLDTASFQVTGTSNEPGAGQISITPNAGGGFDIALQAERSSKAEGRIYTLTATAADLAGNTTTITTTCVVPRRHHGK